MSIELADKLYTSTQVADILGVSLRTLYRYMEDGRIQSMRTASGRHRFTKDQILEFLNIGVTKEPIAEGVSAPIGQGARQQTPSSQFGVQTEQSVGVAQTAKPAVESMIGGDAVQETEEETDEFVVAAPAVESPVEEKESSDTIAQAVVETPAETESVTSVETPTSQVSSVTEEEQAGVGLGVDENIRYYKSDYTDLIELAKKVKDTASTNDLEYAFTLYAGLSLHFLIKPFTKLHFVANPEDMAIWKDALRMVPSQKREEANIGVIVNTDIVFVQTKEIGGFKVVDDKILLKDLSQHNETELVKQFRQHLTTL